MAASVLRFGKSSFPPSNAPVPEEEAARPLPPVREDVDVAMDVEADGINAKELVQRLMRASLAFFASEVIKGDVSSLPTTPDSPVSPNKGLTVIADHQQDWDDIVRTNKLFCIIAPRDHGKSHIFTIALPIWEGWRRPGCIIALFSETQPQAEEQLSKLKMEMESNPRLSHLIDQTCWSAKKIRFTNGSIIVAKGFGTKSRGMHPHLIICDDVVSEAAMYSGLIRERQVNYFMAAVRNMLVPGGTLAVIGCITPDSWVTTADGLKQIGSMCPGPQTAKTLYEFEHPVLGRDGVRKTAKYWVNGRCPTKKITLERGYRIEGSHRHPLLVMGEDGVPKWTRSDAIKPGMWVGLHSGAELWGKPVDLRPFNQQRASDQHYRNSIELPAALSPDLAYLLGLWTAEGSFEALGRVNISNLDQPIRDWLESAPFGLRFKPNTAHGSEQTERCSAKTFLELIEYLGGNLSRAPGKTIPTRIMGADKAAAKAFLQGLFDGDGSVHVQNGAGQVSLYSSSEDLIRRTQTLLLNFGIMASISHTEPRASARVQHPTQLAWALRATGPDAQRFMQEIGFRLERKQAKRGDMRDVASTPGIPMQGTLISGIRTEKPRRTRSAQLSPAPMNITATAQADCPSREQLARVLLWFRTNGATGPCTDQIRLNIAESERGRVWLRVASVEDSESETVDFVIPEGHSFIANGVVNHNTPQHADDLYGRLEKNTEWFFKRYAAIDEKGNILFPERYDKKRLEDRRREIGEIRFAREFLGRPVTGGMSLFPDEFVNSPPFLQDMAVLGPFFPDGTLTRPWWMKRGVTRFYAGVDVATSANVKADYFVIFVMGIDDMGNRWIVDIFREQGMGYKEQKAKISEKSRLWHCDCVVIEANMAQEVYGQELIEDTDLPILRHQTGSEKHSLERGIPSLRLLFENKKYRCPRGSDDTIEATNTWIEELQSWTFDKEKGVISVARHDDTAMAQWLCEIGIHRGESFVFSTDELPGDREEAEALEREEQAMLDSNDDWVMLGLEPGDMAPVGRRGNLDFGDVQPSQKGVVDPKQNVKPKHPLGNGVPLLDQILGFGARKNGGVN